MRFGLMSGASMSGVTVDSIVALAKRAEAAGFASLWMAHIRSIDAIAALGVAGRETTRIELGTAVTPTYPRHPMAMAQQEYAICLQNCVADLVKELKVYGCSLSSDISIVTVAEVLMAAP